MQHMHKLRYTNYFEHKGSILNIKSGVLSIFFANGVCSIPVAVLASTLKALKEFLVHLTLNYPSARISNIYSV